MRHPMLLAAALALFPAAAANADTVDVSSTTLITGGQQTRFRSGSSPDLVTVVPAFEILSISARDVTNPVTDDLRIVLSGWGSYDLDARRWDNGTDSNLTGDLTTGYVQAGFLDRKLQVRLGRESVAVGLGRMIQLDGGDFMVTLPVGLRFGAWAGVPVSQRFASRSGVRSWNPVAGELAYGGRIGYVFSVPGTPGRGFDVGASYNRVDDDDAIVREELGADLRVQVLRDLSFVGFGAYSLYDEKLAEASVAAHFSPVAKLFLTADYRHVVPDLLLARNSILAVFSASERDQFGVGATYELGGGFSAGADYRLQLEPGETVGSDDELGHEASLRGDWRRGGTLAGAEVFFLDAVENGYVGGRLFGRQSFGKAFATADVLAHFFRDPVNGEDLAVTGTLSAGLELIRNFSAVVSGRAGVTPYLEQTYDVMAKLVYNQTYVRREVR